MTDEELQKIINADRPEDIFGELDEDDQLAQLKKTYHQLIRAYHPDRIGDIGDAATKAINLLYEAAQRSVISGVYGTDKAVPVDTVRIRTRLHTYEVTHSIGTGDVCNLFGVKYGEGEEDVGVLKVVRTGRDNDLIKNEANVLQTLHKQVKEDFERAGRTWGEAERLLYYIPKLIETFTYRSDAGRLPQQANVFDHTPNLFTLEQVREKYVDGVPPKDFAWIFRRLLVALQIPNGEGYIHGAILPPHVLIEPTVRGMILVDWKYATKFGERMTAIPSQWKDWYPNEVLNKEPVGPGTDIWLVAQSMAYILGADSGDPVEIPGTVPKALRAFLIGCMLDPENRRPQNPRDLLHEFDGVLERVFGQRTFEPFDMS